MEYSLYIYVSSHENSLRHINSHTDQEHRIFSGSIREKLTFLELTNITNKCQVPHWKRICFRFEVWNDKHIVETFWIYHRHQRTIRFGYKEQSAVEIQACHRTSLLSSWMKTFFWWPLPLDLPLCYIYLANFCGYNLAVGIMVAIVAPWLCCEA